MKIGKKLIIGFMAIASLVGLVGIFSAISHNNIQANSRITTEVLELGILVNESLVELLALNQTENIKDYVREKTDYEQIRAEFDALFKKLDEENEKQLQDLGVNREAFREDADQLARISNRLIALHKRELAKNKAYKEKKSLEKELRHKIQNALFVLQDNALTRDVELMQYKSQETLYEYKDPKYGIEWLESISKIKGNSLIVPLQGTLNDLNAYERVARDLSKIVVEQETIQTQKHLAFRKLQELINLLEENQAKIVNKIKTESQALARNTRLTMVVVIAGAFLVSIILGLTIARSISKPVANLAQTTQAIAQGDFSVRVDVATADEIGELAACFNQMTEDLQRTTTSIDNLNREVTERKKAEEALKESEEKYKLIYETSSDAIMILKPPTWRFTSGNSAIVKMFGVKNEKEFISLRPWEVSPKYQPDGQLSAAKAKKMIETAMKKGKNFFEWTHQTVQGKGFFTTVLLNRIEMKGKAFLQARVTDITERVKAEEQVWRQNEFLNSVLESLTHPFYVIDANDYTVKMANSALYPGKLSEKTACYTLTHKRDKPCNGSDHPCPLEKIKKTKRSVVTEHIHYDRDGNPRNVEVHAYPILDDKGNVSEVIEYTLDITERRQAEEALKSQTGLLNNVISNSPSFIFWKDKNSVYLGCNDNFAKLAGVKKPEDIIGKTDYDLSWKKEESDSYRKTDKEVMTKGTPILDIEERAHQAGGKELTILTNKVPLKNATGEIFGVLGIFTDITAWKKIEQKLTNLAKFPSEDPNPVLRIQKDGKILYGNNAVLPLFAKWKTKAGGLIPAKWRRLVDKAFESEKAISSEEEIDGKIFSFVIAPVTDNDYANMYARDITERKKAEAELKAAQEKLVETAHRAGMAQVAGDVLHNVGNVLTSVNVSTTAIREKVTSSELANLGKVASIINEHTEDLGTFLTEDPQGKHIPVYLTEVSKSLQDEQTDIISRLQVLTDNVRHIKDIVRMQQSYAKVSGVKVQTSLSELAEDAIQINSAGLERYGTRLIRQFDELGDVEIDKQKVLHILVNLISNAKYALSGGNKEEKLLTMRIYKHSEDRFRIEVVDNGVGISEDNQTKIFSHGFTTKKNGHGFGLHSSALASKEMGGSLTVHSDGVGQGATFTLELPFKPIGVMK